MKDTTTTVTVLLMAPPKVDEQPQFAVTTVSLVSNPTSTTTAKTIINKLKENEQEDPNR